MAGDWRGTMTNPWNPPSEIEVRFHGDGTYVATMLKLGDPTWSPLPMYYDTNPETGRWKVQDILSDGEATGWLTLQWLVDQQEPMTEVTLNDELSRLHFTFYHFGMYGPISYDLRCLP